MSDKSFEMDEIRRLEEKVDKNHESLRGSIDKLVLEMGQRVTWGWLWTIVIFCILGAASIAGVLYDEVRQISQKQDAFFQSQNEKTASIREDLSSVNTIMKGLNFKIISN